MGQPITDARHLAGEQFPSGIAGMFGQVIEDDQADVAVAPAQVVQARTGPRASGTGVELAEQPGGTARGHRVEPKIRRRQQPDARARLGHWLAVNIRGRRRGLDGGQFAISDVVADQFVQGPRVQALLLGFEAEHIVAGQVLQPIWQVVHHGRIAVRRLARSAFDDQDIQALTLERQFLFQLYAPRPTGEEIGQGDAEEPVPGGGSGHEGMVRQRFGRLPGECLAIAETPDRYRMVR